MSSVEVGADRGGSGGALGLYPAGGPGGGPPGAG